MPEGWSDLYTFTLEPQRHIDYVVVNHFTATHPSSPFVGQLAALRAEADVQYQLRDRQLRLVRPDGVAEVRSLTATGRIAVLKDPFGIVLSAEEEAHLRTLQDP